ncbi:MAG: thioredoxin [Lachnospiraceae bacterium]|nr:thioredoxin [Lachnospiraceae bacterium]
MAFVFTEENFEKEALQCDMPVLVDFYADWCGPCKMMAPVIEELAAEFEGKAKVGKLNVDNAPSIAQKYRVMTIPTLLILKGGEVKETIVGVTPKAKLAELLNQ